MKVTLLNFKMRLIFMFVAFALFKCNVSSSVGCGPLKRIVFIYDVMDMTANDTDWLSRTIDKSITHMLAKDGRSFCMSRSWYTSHVSYDGEPRANSTSLINNFKITVKTTLETLLEYLRDARSYSVIFVVTNATQPSNESPIIINDILEEIQNKRTQVNFLIGKEISISDTDSLQEYKLIASISNGFIKGQDIFQFDKFADAIYLRLTHQPQEIRTYSLQESNSDTSYCTHAEPFLTDALKNLKLSNCSAQECERKPGNPWRSIMKNLIEKGDDGLTKKLFEETLAKTCSFKKPAILEWFSNKGFTKSDYDFDYGFTIEDVVSLDDTYRRPMNGMTNKIYVSLTDKNFKHGVDHFKILFLNETQFGENIAVEQIPGTDLFVGSFDPPKKEYFYVEVTSYVNNETTVSRISSTAVNAAEGFGDDHGNRIFDHRPIFKSQRTEQQPVSSNSYNYDIYYFIIGALLGLLLLIKCRKCFKLGKKPQQGNELKDDKHKDRYRTVSTVDRV
ncbi:uncharacterized protein LOC135837609 isoform X2 [Planococcus citri]